MYFHQCFHGICLLIFTYAFFMNILKNLVLLRMRLLFQRISHPIVIGPTIAKKNEKKGQNDSQKQVTNYFGKKIEYIMTLAKSLKISFFFFFRIPNNELTSFLIPDSYFLCPGVFTKILSLFHKILKYECFINILSKTKVHI